MSLRDAEDPSVIGARWAASMKGSVRARTVRSDDGAAKAARDAANQRGADAWSPSRAREALRVRISACIRIYESMPQVKRAMARGDKILTPAQFLEREADRAGAFDNMLSFGSFLASHNLEPIEMAPIGWYFCGTAT